MMRRSFLLLFTLVLPTLALGGDSEMGGHSSSTPGGTNATAVSKFDWDIYKLNVTVTPSLPVNVLINYNISNRETIVALFEYDCKTPMAPRNLISVNKKFTPTPNTAHGNLEVQMKIGQNYKNSSIWQEESPSLGYLDFCIRLDLILVDAFVQGNFPSAYDSNYRNIIDAISVNFRETKVSLRATVGGRMEMMNIGNVEVTACQCERKTRRCVNDTIVDMVTDIAICMESNYPNALFTGVESMDFLLNDKVAYSPIRNAMPNTVTAMTQGLPNGLVLTRLGNSLYNTAAKLEVQGVAILEFNNGSGGSRRLVRTKIGGLRHLQTTNNGSDQDGFFQLNMDIDTTTDSPFPWWIIVMCTVMGCVALYFYLRRLKHNWVNCLR